MLIEFTKLPDPPGIFALASVAARERLQSRNVGFWPDLIPGALLLRIPLVRKVIKGLIWNLPWPLTRLYREAGITDLILPILSRKQVQAADRAFSIITQTVTSRKELEKIKLRGVLIGDLFYDSVLKDLQVGTIDVRSSKVKKSLKKSISLFIFWSDWFKSNDVLGAIGTHRTYRLGIPLRLAASQNLLSVELGWSHAIKLSKDALHPNHFEGYPQIFGSLRKSEQEEALKNGRDTLRRRLQGERLAAFSYLKSSPYRSSKIDPGLETVIEPDSFVIYTHAFADAPHSLGFFLFPDYWAWLDFLGDIATRSERRWYVKAHPNASALDLRLLGELCRKKPSLTLLEPGVSNQKILEAGCAAALTVHGSMAVEFASQGIPVINAGEISPTRAYDFALHASTIEELKELISNVEELRFVPDLNKVAEYEFMHNHLFGPHLFYDPLRTTIQEVLSGTAWTPEFVRSGIQTLSDFLTSGETSVRSHPFNNRNSARVI